MKKAFAATISNFASKNKNIVLITGDLGFGVLTDFQEKFPDQFINAGICEQNMTSVAAGMALEGKIVFTYSIGNFSTLRCLEQIRNDVCYHNANVKIVSVGGGFSYGPMGITHHATEDIAILRALPGMTVFVPCDIYETQAILRLAVEIKGPCYIRLGKGGEGIINNTKESIQLGRAVKVREGNEISIFAAGPIIKEAIVAADILKEQNIECSIYSFHTIKPLDKDTILEAAKDSEIIMTLEEHNNIGGLGGAVAEILSSEKNSCKLIRLGLNDEYSSKIGSQVFLRKVYGLDSDSIVKIIQKQNLRI